MRVIDHMLHMAGPINDPVHIEILHMWYWDTLQN
jgi:hypothetical protein